VILVCDWLEVSSWRKTGVALLRKAMEICLGSYGNSEPAQSGQRAAQPGTAAHHRAAGVHWLARDNDNAPTVAEGISLQRVRLTPHSVMIV
jgi:hypothetical protein